MTSKSDLAVLKVNVADLSSDTLSQIAVATIGDSDELVVGNRWWPSAMRWGTGGQ